MSLVEDLLIILTDYSAGYKLMRSKLAGYENLHFNRKINYQEIKEQVLRVTLSRLKKQGLVDNKNGIWRITKKGRIRLINRKLRKPHFKNPNNKNKKKRDLIIIFDIPEKIRIQRDWLRSELIALGFIPLQKSVWLGPSPLPQEFIEYLNTINLLKYIKFFKVSEEKIVG